ncbi:MAG: phosphoglycerate kinase, partial [Desulfovibrionales bacterium]
PKGGIASGVKPFQDIPDGEMTLDTGPASHALFAEVLKDAKTIIWNGPLGVFENPAFSQGSVGMAHLVAGLDATTIVGGGDTDALIHLCKIEDKFSFISTGGGSFLEYLQGRELPAIKALKECAR